MKSLVILISGRGSNMQALIEAKLPLKIAAVISNKPDAAGLKIAKQHGVETRVVDHRAYPDREAFDAALVETIDHFHPDLVALAGFMRILGDGFVNHYQGRLMNIHPSLLPAFPGLDTHARALQDGVKTHGCTVHFVTPQLDHGPIIIQATVPVLPDDNAQTLEARVLQQERHIYPQAVRWFAEGKLKLSDNRVEISDAAADSPASASVPHSPGLRI